MDQVRIFLKILIQQRFWVLSVVGVIVVVVCWMLSASALDKQYRSERSKIDKQFSDMQSINSKSFYPNPEVNKADLAQTRALCANVFKVWHELYDRQRSEVLYWPKDNVLGEEFVEKIEKLRFGNPINTVMRETYLNYIKHRFDGLLEIAKAKKLAGRGAAAGGQYGLGGEGGGYAYGSRTDDLEEEEDDHIVQWLDQANLRVKLEWKRTPSSMLIWVTQEDLWVYETLLEVIAQTNQASGATRPDNAAIRVIANLQVGREAAQHSKRLGTIITPQPTGEDTGGGMADSYGGGDYGGGDYGGGDYGDYGGGGYGEPDMGGMGGGGDPYGGLDMGGPDGEGGGGGNALLEGRYVDAEGNPKAGDVESLATAPFRRLPIRMVLLMDQRWVPQVLVECANQVLPIEVKRVSVNASQAGAGFGSRRTGASRVMKGVDGQLVEGMATVEIQGVVYIYNPPDKGQLAVPGGDENEDQDGQFAGN